MSESEKAIRAALASYLDGLEAESSARFIAACNPVVITRLLAEIDHLRAGDAIYQWLLKNGLFAQPHGSDTQIGIHGTGPVGVLFVNDICTHCPTTAIRAAIAEQGKK